MKVLYLECKMGCAGDMLMGALSELVDKETFINKMNSLGLKGVEAKALPSNKCGILGTHIEVKINGEEEITLADNEALFKLYLDNIGDEQIHHLLDHIKEVKGVSNISYNKPNLTYICDHDNDKTNKIIQIILDHYPNTIINDEGHSHHKTITMNLKDIDSIIDNLPVSQKVKDDAKNVYEILANAECKVHGKDINNIHFHEVGTIDALVDIVGNCILFEMINADRIICSNIALGNGMVKCAHGILPIPAPATANILIGIPTYAGNVNGELCTPTGAALLKYFADSFENQPTLKVHKIGYGMGRKDFPVANCLRAFIGEMNDDGEVIELTCNIDDMTPEEIGFVYDILFDNDALDICVIPVYMKKNRPGYVFTVLCKIKDKDKIIELMFKHLTTLGIRETSCIRHTLQRHIEEVDTDFGKVRIKKSFGYNIEKEKIEYEDLAKIAKKTNKPISQIRRKILEETK